MFLEGYGARHGVPAETICPSVGYWIDKGNLLLARLGDGGAVVAGVASLDGHDLAGSSRHFQPGIYSLYSANSSLREFQKYKPNDLLVWEAALRAKAAGYRALVVTIDTPVLGQRERDVRSGLVLPPRITVRNVLDTLRRVSWLRDFLTHPRPTFGNFVGMAGVEHDAVSLAAFTTKQFSASIGWADIDWYRSLWPGPIALKGIMSAEDARMAAERGIEAVIVSNHGGRQLDHAPAPIEVLPEIVDAVDGRAEVILDGGVRRGTDVVKALALGARACMIGKAFNYGVAALGEPGVELAIDILQREIDRALALIGRPTLAQLDRSAVQLRAGAGR